MDGWEIDRKMQKAIGKNSQPLLMKGSITVFLALIFGILLSLVTVTLENVRVLTAKSYVEMGTEAAIRAAFGEYNRELYEEYGLFGYGGYGQEDANSLLETIAENIRCCMGEDREEGSTDLHQLTLENCQYQDTCSMTEEQGFYEQIQQCLKVKGVQNIVQNIMGQHNESTKGGQKLSIDKSLKETESYEKGEYVPAESTSVPSAAPGAMPVPSVTPDASPLPSAIPSATAEQTTEKLPDKENPLMTFRELLRDGVLHLVCDLPEEKAVELPDSTAGLLRGLLADRKECGAIQEVAVQKAELLSYANEMFSSYTTDKQRTTRCGLEYLVTGKEAERDCLADIVYRLLALRTAVNFVYVNSDQTIKAESLATATAITTAIALPVLTTPIQQTILLVLAVEESLVDITALLQGRIVPLTKNRTNFQIKYAEICSAGKTFFAQKAKGYPLADGKLLAQGGFSYTHYLLLFLLFQQQDVIRTRMCELIQIDLREKYQQSFSMERCIQGVSVKVEYEQKLFWNRFYDKEQDAVERRTVLVKHHYQ
ncbi:MAG: DUF5702 domain-containing protein [Lachnospiraceae bacterium]|nr:DUF5702 domain-containing protein [Lachnospiraceae bacterium]